MNTYTTFYVLLATKVIDGPPLSVQAISTFNFLARIPTPQAQAPLQKMYSAANDFRSKGIHRPSHCLCFHTIHLNAHRNIFDKI